MMWSTPKVTVTTACSRPPPPGSCSRHHLHGAARGGGHLAGTVAFGSSYPAPAHHLVRDDHREHDRPLHQDVDLLRDAVEVEDLGRALEEAPQQRGEGD